MSFHLIVAMKDRGVSVKSGKAKGATTGAKRSERTKKQLPEPTKPADVKSQRSRTQQTDLDCTHFQHCSGCTINTQLHRPSVVENAEHYFQSHGLKNFLVEHGEVTRWRCRARLAVQGSTKHPKIGLYRQGTHQVEDIPHCVAHHPFINEVVDQLRRIIRVTGVQPYDEETGQGDLRYVQLTVHKEPLPTVSSGVQCTGGAGVE